MFVPLTAQSELQDEEVVARVLAGETALFEVLMRRYNQRLYRMSRMILHNDGEAEDVMQDAYVRAYEHLDQFAGKAAFPPGSPESPSMKRWRASAAAAAWKNLT